MPIKQAAIKALRQARKRTLGNRKMKVEMKSLVKKAKAAIEEKNQEAAALSRQLQQLVDKAVKKGLVKKNTAARKKSRLMKKVNALIKK